MMGPPPCQEPDCEMPATPETHYTVCMVHDPMVAG